MPGHENNTENSFARKMKAPKLQSSPLSLISERSTTSSTSSSSGNNTEGGFRNMLSRVNSSRSSTSSSSTSSSKSTIEEVASSIWNVGSMRPMMWNMPRGPFVAGFRL